MTASETLNKRHEAIKEKLKTIKLPDGDGTRMCWDVAVSLGKTGQTIKNYLKGDIKDGYLAEAIFKEFKKFKKLN